MKKDYFKEISVCWDCRKKVNATVTNEKIYARTIDGYRLVICKECWLKDDDDY